jgi:hypothetical protein
MKKIIFKSSLFIIALIYLMGVIIFGEEHPFSKFSMYSSFADYSYVFYFTDKENKMIKCTELNSTGTNLAHMYTTVCEMNNFKHGHGMESDSVLHEVGKQMLNIVKINNIKLIHHNKKVKLNRMYFYYEGEIIKCKKQEMYETVFN